MKEQRLILTARCPSAAGQVASIAQFLEERRCYIEDISVFDSHDRSTFFLRCVFHTEALEPLALDRLRSEFQVVGIRFGMEWALYDTEVKPRVMIMVSRYDHCLNDLLYRWRIGELQVEITAIVSNHPDLAHIAASNNVAFHHLPITTATKEAQEDRLKQLIAETCSDVVVLARYMQILSLELCKELSGRAINIHHSFLPGFKGAKPHQQAYDRGVKIIGATAHYVTTDLDEGPIIEQAVTNVSHTADVEQLQSMGRDMECLALSRALKLHIERRVFLHGAKTVILLQ
jgi:formyltetrahydrofolate deformylase